MNMKYLFMYTINTAEKDCAATHEESHQQTFLQQAQWFVDGMRTCQKRLLSWVRSRLFPGPQISHPLRVCVPISAFPVTGGMRTVLSNIAQVTGDIWQIEYLTHAIGPHSERFIIHQFGTRRMGPWQFPAVWLYVFAGFWKLFSLLRHGARYDVILLQDGIYTAAFGALVAKLAGIRSICIDHGNLSVLKSRAFRAECQKALATKNWSYPRLLLARLQYACYWPSLHVLARMSARLVDHYFIPGVAGDGVEEICKSIGVHPERITRFANMIDADKYITFSTPQKAAVRESYGIPAEAIVIAIICRLAPEKGLEIALEAIGQALTALSPTMRSRLRLVIAGDGPLRQKLEDAIHERNLSQTCLLWGEASVEEVSIILGLSEIFLFTSWRAAGYPLTVLEAMASGCAVIAATESLATSEMLGEGRGIVLSGGNVEGTANAIVRLVSNLDVCHSMGHAAKDYVAANHSATTFRRSLLWVTSWSSLNEFLYSEREN
ncbi:MAG: glycosyltransferase family 4 protein [Chloroflexota bacterium]|nr:glycosyltransferase family 4 protein [Chloroflexota bacterium]